MNTCPDTEKPISECPCAVCAPLRRILAGSKPKRGGRNWRPGPALVTSIPPGETDRRLKDALTALPPSDRD